MIQYLAMVQPHGRSSFRRKFLNHIITLVILGLAADLPQTNWTKRLHAGHPEHPNIVFIMADDLGWSDVSFHGGNAPTPHLDRLASESLELKQHYVAPVCSPTRTGLMTGRCWSRFGVVNPQNQRALPWETVTLPRALQSVGYDTCLTGKWHLGSLPEEGPNHFGFDHSYGSLAGGVSPWNHRYKKGPFTETWHRNETRIEEPGHVTDLITTEAIAWLKRPRMAPFFLYVPYTAVHLPVKEPQIWVDAVPASITGDVRRHYAASIMHLDDCVGKLLSTLEELDVRDNTLVVFTSDNGGSTAENNDLKYPDDNCPNGRLPGNNAPLRGQKGDLYEGGTRVPTLVCWPRKISPGASDEPVQITDWMPTFSALVDYQSDKDLKWDGTDISAVLLERKPLPERALYTVAPSWRGRSLRWGDWKLIVQGKEGQERRELFNIRTDPGESRNRLDEETEVADRLREAMDQIAADDRDSVVGGD
ncbi:MAG: sulfatase-like hydrolase/transferase [Planctomycetaceae bacterium]|nr:sulfatase-like hydrolase/transferase [Planctomycetaceae bacterium]